ncbi:carboxymuconolactone decarboxylase family protein [Limibacter armeniacum]|uniref:carboxymuconolactone decarboxylase family protein n=1 Tax=Limibacter armeniacum TaxID=466084 RepID=UPI002FE56D34
MKSFKIHNIETAPEKSKTLLEGSQKANGFIPNLHGVLAESPELFKAYQSLHELFMNTSFDKEELTVVWQTINVEHACHYCVPAHTAIANMMKVDTEITEALRNSTKMPTEKLQILHEMTLSLTRNRGNVTDAEVEAFFVVGYEQKHLLEIILGISQKVISNYTNRIAETALDQPFNGFAWSK